MLRRLPHPFALLFGGILVAAALTHAVPAGEYARRADAATGRALVDPGTYHAVPADPATVMDVLRAVPRGIAQAADVLAVVFLVGAAFVVVDRTGALGAALAALTRRLGGRTRLAIPVCCLVFAAGGALQNMQEEFVALVPPLVLLAARAGGDPLTAVAMSLGAAAVGAAFSPVNPFQVGIAQQAAGLPAFSDQAPRLILLAIAVPGWIWFVMRQARASKAAVPTSAVADREPRWTPRAGVVLLLVLAGFVVFLSGLTLAGWGFDELSAVFLAVGVLAGLAGGLGVSGTASAMADGFRDMAFAALLIGVARGIFVVLDDAHVIDTLVRGLAAPLADVPSPLAVLGMVGLHTAVHVPVPSVSGQAVLTLPILAPLSDLLSISRQAAVLAYQTGAGLCELVTPTNGALMAVLAAAGVGYDRWLRFVLPAWLGLLGLGTLAAFARMAAN
ncbi:MAG: YfcC family protein [Vicinamibacterales bacterium]